MTKPLPPSGEAVHDFSTVDQNKLAYLAGVVDSDGSIGIYKYWNPNTPNVSPRYVLSIVVVNTSERLMNWLADTFGGTFKARKMTSPNHKATYSWQFNNAKAAHLLSLIKPYLVEKWDRAANGIEFIEGGNFSRKGHTPLTEEELARREAHYLVSKMLNKTGNVQPQRLNSRTPDGFQDDAIV